MSHESNFMWKSIINIALAVTIISTIALFDGTSLTQGGKNYDPLATKLWNSDVVTIGFDVPKPSSASGIWTESQCIDAAISGDENLIFNSINEGGCLDLGVTADGEANNDGWSCPGGCPSDCPNGPCAIWEIGGACTCGKKTNSDLGLGLDSMVNDNSQPSLTADIADNAEACGANPEYGGKCTHVVNGQLVIGGLCGPNERCDETRGCTCTSNDIPPAENISGMSNDYGTDLDSNIEIDNIAGGGGSGFETGLIDECQTFNGYCYTRSGNVIKKGVPCSTKCVSVINPSNNHIDACECSQAGNVIDSNYISDPVSR